MQLFRPITTATRGPCSCSAGTAAARWVTRPSFLVPQDGYLWGFLGVRIPGCLFLGGFGVQIPPQHRAALGDAVRMGGHGRDVVPCLPHTPKFPRPPSSTMGGFSQFTPSPGGGRGVQEPPGFAPHFLRGLTGLSQHHGLGDPWHGRQPPRTQNIWVSLTQHFGVWEGGHGGPPGPVSHWGAQGGSPAVTFPIPPLPLGLQ